MSVRAINTILCDRLATSLDSYTVRTRFPITGHQMHMEWTIIHATRISISLGAFEVGWILPAVKEKNLRFQLITYFSRVKMMMLMLTGANGRKSKAASAVDHLRNVHVAIISDDTNLVCDMLVSITRTILPVPSHRSAATISSFKKRLDIWMDSYGH